MSVVIKKSNIQGKGVFAASNIKKGRIVMKWDDSIIITKREFNRIPKRYRKYLVLHKGKYIFTQSPERYLNHSCNPNTKEGNLCDIALRNIRKGEELTTDYTTNSPHVRMRCACGSKNCKRII